jgi:hypothetical protein
MLRARVTPTDAAAAGPTWCLDAHMTALRWAVCCQTGNPIPGAQQPLDMCRMIESPPMLLLLLLLLLDLPGVWCARMAALRWAVCCQTGTQSTQGSSGACCW